MDFCRKQSFDALPVTCFYKNGTLQDHESGFFPSEPLRQKLNALTP